jgi:hypothetical protein
MSSDPGGCTPLRILTKPTQWPAHEGGHLTMACAAAARYSSTNGRTGLGMDRACPACLRLLLAWEDAA